MTRSEKKITLHLIYSFQVRQAFRRQKEKHSLTKENISQYNASFSLSVRTYNELKMQSL